MTTDKIGRYIRHKNRTTLAVSRDIHEVVKWYASSKNMRLEDATEELLKIAIAKIRGYKLKTVSE